MPAIAPTSRKMNPKSANTAAATRQTDQHQDLHQRRLGFLREEINPALQKSRQGMDQPSRLWSKPAMSRGIAEPHRVRQPCGPIVSGGKSVREQIQFRAR